jgi:hypothetical protein
MSDIYIVSKPNCPTGALLSIVRGVCNYKLKAATVKQAGALAFCLSKDQIKKLKAEGCTVKSLKDIQDERRELIRQELQNQ